MKRIVLSLLAVLAFALATRAQNYNYVPRETWPYLLEDFTPGVVRTPAGGEPAPGAALSPLGAESTSTC